MELNMKKLFVTTLLTLSISACGDGASEPPIAQENQSPIIIAIEDKTVNENNSLTVAAIASDNDGAISSYLWSQKSGVAVTLINTTSAEVSITPPAIDTDEEITLIITVTDNQGATSFIEFKVNIIALPTFNLGESRFGQAKLG